MTLGTDTETTDDDVLGDLERLAYLYSDEYGSAKLEYYKEYLLRQETINDEVVEPNVVNQPIETPTKPSNGPPMDSAWPMKCHDNRHTSRSYYSTLNITDFEKWRFLCDGGIDSSPVIGYDGVIYFGDKSYPDYLYAIYPNSTLKWKFPTGGWITSTPALAEDGTLYVGSWDNHLYALNSSNGIRKWKFNAKGTISSSTAIGDDGTIYFGTMGDEQNGHRIWAINSDGTEKWYFKTGGDITSDPVIGDDGTIYIGSMDDYFYAINPNGTLKWRYKTGDYVMGSPSIAEDGSVYSASWDNYLYAFHPENGTVKWRCKIGAGSKINPSIASDGTIYVGANKLFAIYPNGTRRWSFDLGNERHIAWSSPAISAEGTIYVGTNIGEVSGGDIIAINPDGTERWRKKICNEWCDSSPCIAKDGTVYIGSQDNGGYLHAFGPVESNEPPKLISISGKTNGEVGESYWYTFKTIDPDKNPIKLYIDWGDGTSTGWTTREWASGENANQEHTWSEKGNYTIKAKAKDVLNVESDWAYLEINIPRTRTTTYHWLLERFPLLERLLILLL